MVTKKQHYYPRCLLKHFANDDKKVFVYIRKGDKKAYMNYEKICASNYTYESDNQVDNVLEHKLGKYESKGSVAKLKLYAHLYKTIKANIVLTVKSFVSINYFSFFSINIT
ncbi:MULTISPECIES: DUF4238 domain-containing protein [Staphylococcus]|uniref:DUF4238 domain-containing protein n=1 Tax=Staphylococcus TaxID=1279 RepID=UPI001E4F2D14|nr:DUF4238 domain-containing protein [Staphylococcus epidermidis]